MASTSQTHAIDIFCALTVTEHWSEKSHPPNSAWDINRAVIWRHHVAITVTVSCFTLALL